jgi:hypothetical protein
MPWSARGRVEDEPRGVHTNALTNALRDYKQKAREFAHTLTIFSREWITNA